MISHFSDTIWVVNLLSGKNMQEVPPEIKDSYLLILKHPMDLIFLSEIEITALNRNKPKDLFLNVGVIL